MIRIAVGLGSNLGDRIATIDRASQFIGEFCSGLELSSLYESEPMYVEDQNRFINAVLIGSVEIGPIEVLARLKQIEQYLGRIERERNGPREIDCDLLDFGGVILRSDRLVLPHSRMLERRFVIEPLVELVSEFYISGVGAAKRQLELDEIVMQGMRRVRHATF